MLRSSVEMLNASRPPGRSRRGDLGHGAVRVAEAHRAVIAEHDVEGFGSATGSRMPSAHSELHRAGPAARRARPRGGAGRETGRARSTSRRAAGERERRLRAAAAELEHVETGQVARAPAARTRGCGHAPQPHRSMSSWDRARPGSRRRRRPRSRGSSRSGSTDSAIRCHEVGASSSAHGRATGAGCVPASVIAAPPKECPTSSTGPSIASSAVRTASPWPWRSVSGRGSSPWPGRSIATDGNAGGVEAVDHGLPAPRAVPGAVDEDDGRRASVTDAHRGSGGSRSRGRCPSGTRRCRPRRCRRRRGGGAAPRARRGSRAGRAPRRGSGGCRGRTRGGRPGCGRCRSSSARSQRRSSRLAEPNSSRPFMPGGERRRRAARRRG